MAMKMEMELEMELGLGTISNYKLLCQRTRRQTFSSRFPQVHELVH